MRWLGLAPLLWLLCACDVASVLEAPNTIAHNQCQSSAECGNGSCIESQCRSTTTSLQNLLFEVTPPADSSAIAGVQFLVSKNALKGDDTSLVLNPISQLAGRVTTKQRLATCTPRFGDAGNELLGSSDSSMPAQLSLIPTTGALGLYSPRAVVQSVVSSDATYFGFSAAVPPGIYDIYVEPKYQPDQTCAVPPQLLRGREITPGKLTLDIDLPDPSMFEFHVSWPNGGGALNGWLVDMLDPASGRVISNRVQLALGKDPTDYQATLAYSSVTFAPGASASASAQPQDQLLRLSPPDGSPDSAGLPTVLMARSALALFDANSGTLTDFTNLPSPVHVVGQVTSGVSTDVVPASLSFVATEITGIDSGVLTSFVRTATTAIKTGLFEVDLLPGKYRVTTVPLAPFEPSRVGQAPIAADVRTWIVPSSPTTQAGKVIELSDAVPISGRVLDVANLPVTAKVQAFASTISIIQPDFLREALDGTQFVPRASTGDVSNSGDFALSADPGTFDVSVRPNADTGFAWLVMPSVPVMSQVGAFLGPVTMPLPFSYRGTVISDSGDAVPGALIRAYVYLKDGQYTTSDDPGANSVLQIAETRADTGGNFEAFIPAELNQHAE